MDSVVNTDALLYVVIAKTLMAIVFLVIAAVAIKFGARLFCRGLEVSSTEKTILDHDVNVKRLTKDTWLPKGTLIKTKDKDPSDAFVKLDKDSWMPSGTLVRTPARDLETQLKLQIAGILLMLSSLFWGWMSYLTSPLDVQSLNSALASSQEHKIRNLFGNLQNEIGALLTNVRDLKQASDSNVKTDTLQTGLNQIGNVLTNQLSALQQEMGVIKSEMTTVKNQPQQFQQSMNNLSAQLQQLATEQTSVKIEVENNQLTALQKIEQSIATLANQVQTTLGQVQQNLQPQPVIEKLQTVENELAQIKLAINQSQTDKTLQSIQQELTTLKMAQTTPENVDMQGWVDEHFNALKNEISKLQQDLENFKSSVINSLGNNQEVKASLGKVQEELAHLQPLAKEIQVLKTTLTDLHSKLDNELNNKIIQPGMKAIKTPFGDRLVPDTEQKPNSIEESFVGKVIEDKDIPVGHRRVRTPFGDVLVKDPLVTGSKSPKPEPPKMETPKEKPFESTNSVLKTLISPETPKLKDWGAYVDISLSYGAGKTKPSDLKPLATLGEALQIPQLKDQEILLQGYTDNKGNEETNREVSQKRADYIKGYLVKNYGLDAAKIKTEGKGQNDPIAPNKTAEGRAQNRRIRVSVR
jgi:hypothetical protein